MDFPELNHPQRGYRFYPERDAIPELYETEDVPLAQKVVHEHFFVRGGTGEWHVFEVESSSATSCIAFAMCDLGTPELGYVDLVALESLRIDRPGLPPIVVERDVNWQPRPWSKVER